MISILYMDTHTLSAQMRESQGGNPSGKVLVYKMEDYK